MSNSLTSILILLSFITILSREVPDYDSYVFALQWKNNVCKPDDLLCLSLEGETEPNQFTIHGLWPSESKTDKYLEDCINPPSIEIRSDGSGLFANMQKVWGSYFKTDSEFWTHEYNKHGFCYVHKYNLSGPKDYFKKTLELYYSQDYRHLFKRVFPNQPAGEIHFTEKKLREKIDRVFPGQFYKLNCEVRGEKIVLIEIFIGFDLDFKPLAIVDSNILCPDGKDIHILFK